MNELYDTLVALGPKWANLILAANIVGAALFVLINRKYYRAQTEAYDAQTELLKSNHAEQMSLKEDLITHLKLVKNDAEKERDLYRAQLHEEKKVHQATQLRLHESESRPSFHGVQKEQRDFFLEVHALMKKLDQRVELSLKQSSDICTQSVVVMNGVIDYLKRTHILPDEQ